MNFPVPLNKFFPFIAIILTFILVIRCSEKTTSCCCKECNCKNYMIVSTLNGSITAVDLNSGQQCWSVLLDPEKFLSSSLSKLEVYENAKRIFLVPSLDGGIYKYDPLKRSIIPLPVNVSTIISHSDYLDPQTIINGGTIKIIHGIHRLTGEMIYTCNVSGCINFKIPFPKDMLVIEEVIQTINAIDTSKAEKRWHFRVVELKVKVASNKNASTFTDTNNETGLISHIPPKVNDFINLDVYKISLKNGFAGMMNKTTDEFSWIFKAPSPINDAWIVMNDLIEVLDPFDKETRSFSIDIDDGQHSALLFLGIYEGQIFIKRSRKFQQKQSDVTSLMQNYIYDTDRCPFCLMEDAVLEPHLEPGGTGLIPHHEHSTVSDYGFYFYANVSIAENTTHCIVNYTILHVTQMTEDIIFDIQIWFTFTSIIAGVTFSTCLTWLIWILSIRSKEEKSSTNKSTISVPVSSSQEYNSRFIQDFDFISILGKGGFGVVMVAKKKMDDRHYAVKRIRLHEKLNDSQYNKVRREVTALASLDHPGIVRYFHSWTEYPPAGWQEKMDEETNICDISKSTFEGNNEGTGDLILKSTKSSYRKSQKLKNTNHIVLEKLKKNPFELSNNDLFTGNVPSEESELSAHSSDVNDSNNSFTSSEENSNGNLSEKDKAGLTECTESDSDSFIQFENDDLPIKNNTAQFSFDNGNVENLLPASSKKQKKTKTNEVKSSLSTKCNQSKNLHIAQFSGDKRNEENQLGNEENSIETHKERKFARGYLYIQMQLCQKETLRDWLTDHSGFRDYNEVMEFFTEIVKAVDYVHRCKLMHRDLKPSNIYFSLEGAIKVGDFGLATSSEINVEHGSSYHLSDIHTSNIGTELYMSPEQKLKQHYDEKTDIYSLGIIFFELLFPFKTSSERYKVLLDARKLKFPEKFKRNFQDESQLVELLLDNDPKGRPTASQIMQHPVIVKFMST